MGFNLGKIVGFIINHADEGVKAVEAIKTLTNGGDKKAAVFNIIEEAVKLSDFTDTEKALALLPQCRAAWDAVIETRVAAMKADQELRKLIAAVQASHQ